MLSVRDSCDKSAFVQLFGYFAPRLKSYIIGLGSDQAMAEEIAQQTMLQVWRKADLFDPSRAQVSTWIFRIARNYRLDVLRKAKHIDIDDYAYENVPDERDDQEVHLSRQQDVGRVQVALETLSYEQRRVVELSFYEGQSHGEIADTLKLPLGTVKSRMRLAFQHLKAVMEDRV